MDDNLNDDPVFDMAYLRGLLTEVRPDATLDDFSRYANLPDDVLASLLAEAQDAGEVAVYADEFNAPIVCLTPLGMVRARVKLSQSHPPIWLSVDGEDPPMIAAQQHGFILFTDLDGEYEDGEKYEFISEQTDPRQLEPVEVLTAVEEFGAWLQLSRDLPGGRKIPKSNEFVIYGMSQPWPLDRPYRAAPGDPSASTWQEQHTLCPFCRHLKPGEPCGACNRQAPGRPCKHCRGVRFSEYGLCNWCCRAGIDPFLPAAEVVQSWRRSQVKSPKKGKAKTSKKGKQPNKRKRK